VEAAKKNIDQKKNAQQFLEKSTRLYDIETTLPRKT